MRGLGIPFEVISNHDTDESFPPHLGREEIPVFVARQKATSILPKAGENALVITADTIVWCEGHVVNKPQDEKEAMQMLRLLSGRMHEVHTGVCLCSSARTVCFHVCTEVYFTSLSDDEISHYVLNYRPFDKAGAYGIQEWIGYIGVERIEGSYFNVMGLPVQRLYKELKIF